MWPSSKYFDLGHGGRVKCPKKQGHMFSSLDELFQFLQSKLSFSFSFKQCKKTTFSHRRKVKVCLKILARGWRGLLFGQCPKGRMIFFWDGFPNTIEQNMNQSKKNYTTRFLNQKLNTPKTRSLLLFSRLLSPRKYQ